MPDIDTVAQAARLRKRHDIGVRSVVEDRVGRKLPGVVTDRDLALRVLAGAVFAMAAAVPAGEKTVDATVDAISVREAPAGSTLPGIHLEAKLDGRDTDIYLAPASFPGS